MIKYILASLVLFSSAVFGQTVINFDDGSTYTLKEKEEIFISNSNSAFFKRKLMKDKSTYFIVQKPWAKRDHVPQPTDGMTKGSHEWCSTYEPWSEGFTWDMQTWQRHCDSNDDGVYDENDDRWDG